MLGGLVAEHVALRPQARRVVIHPEMVAPGALVAPDSNGMLRYLLPTKDRYAQVVAFAFGLAAASLFPVILMGIFNKRMNKYGAITGMLVGLVFTMGYIVYFKGVFIQPMAANVPENWLFGISPEGIGFVGMFLNFITAYVVSKVTAPPPEHIQHLVEDIRIPRGATGATH